MKIFKDILNVPPHVVEIQCTSQTAWTQCTFSHLPICTIRHIRAYIHCTHCNNSALPVCYCDGRQKLKNADFCSRHEKNAQTASATKKEEEMELYMSLAMHVMYVVQTAESGFQIFRHIFTFGGQFVGNGSPSGDNLHWVTYTLSHKCLQNFHRTSQSKSVVADLMILYSSGSHLGLLVASCVNFCIIEMLSSPLFVVLQELNLMSQMYVVTQISDTKE
jgi:hypothetical protein